MLLLLSLTLGWMQPVLAQGDIPLGTWRTHFSYAQVHTIALAGNRVYAASENGFFYFDKVNNETFELGPLKGFNDVGVSALAWQPQQNRLLIGYRSGNIYLLRAGKVTNIAEIRNAQFTGSKTLREVAFRGDSVILAADYGISIIDLAKARLLDSYLNLGPEGQRVVVYDVAVFGDTLYAATEAGLIANRLSPSANLNDYRSWRRYGPEEGLPLTGSHFLAVQGQQLWLANSNGKLYRKHGGSWSETSFSSEDEILDLQPSQKSDILTITSLFGIHQYSISQDIYTTTRYAMAPSPLTAIEDADETLWIGDRFNGLLVRPVQDHMSRRTPDGPLSDAVTGLHYDNGQVIALSGGADAFGNPLGRQGFSVFTTARGWINYHPQSLTGSRSMPAAQDLTAAAYSPRSKRWYFASYSDGLLAWQPQDDAFELWGLSSPGTSFTGSTRYPDKVLLRSIGVDGEGSVWMSSYGSNRPLHRYQPAEGRWDYFLEGDEAASYARQLIIPFTNDVWLRLQPEKPKDAGILVFNPSKQPKIRLLDKESGSGGIVSNTVLSLQEDLEGSVWVGTNDGLSYFTNPSAVLTNSRIDASLPVFQPRPLLDESAVSALAVDGGNRKWIGTTNGIWLFGDAGDTLYHHFTTGNSPLPSNTIRAVTVDQQTGEVFIATDKGLVSYRSGATAGGSTHAEAIKIFPNPVRPSFQGQVGITGLVQDAVVKITNTAGFLVRELSAEGGTAAWDLRDSRGQQVAAGVYLVFSANTLGTETLVGKVAVVR